MLKNVLFSAFCLGVAGAWSSNSLHATEVEPAVIQWTRTGEFAGANGKKIAYAVARAPKSKNSVVILPGYGESYLFYQDLANDFIKASYSVYIMDLRGMGLSSRILPDKPTMGHIDKFSYYVDDAENFVKNIVAKEAPADNLFLFGHSTGGLIASHLLARLPKTFKKAFLSAPLFELNLGGAPLADMMKMVDGAIAKGMGTEYAPGAQESDPNKQTWDEAKNILTHDKNFAENIRKIKIENPQSVTGGASFLWIKTILDETQKTAEIANKVKTPILLAQAEQDALVLPGGQKTFCELAKNCKIQVFKGSRHEIFREVLPIRTEVKKSILSHLKI